MSSTFSTIKDLVQTLEDGVKGYTDAAKKLADDGHESLASTMRGYADQRQRFSSELRRLAGEQGQRIDEDGSMAASLHRGWMGLKDALTGSDSDAVLDAVKQGEDHAVSTYEDALDGEELPAPVATEVRNQRDQIKTTRTEIDHLTV